MSTQVGNTTKSFGKEYNISTTNYDGNRLLNTEDLRENSLIVSAKVDNNLEDIGSYSLFFTDADGKAVRLTYTLQPGSGLYPDPNDGDVLRMVIDNSSITSDGDELYVNKRNIIDNDTLTVNATVGDNAKRGRIGVVTENLEKATNMRFGIAKADEYTTRISSPGKISVVTQNLETVDDASNRDGIVKHSSEMFRTISAIDGKIQVITENLDKASSVRYGVVKTDNKTIRSNNSGTISVITSGLDKATDTSHGIVKGDEYTAEINEYGEITVNTHNLEPATGESRGVVMLDTWSIDTNPANGKIEVKRFNEIEALLNTNNPEHKLFREDIEDLKNRVSKLETMPLQEVIEFLSPTGDPETTLPMPKFDKETWKVDQYSDTKTIAFTIKSNCKFNVNVEYKEGTNDYSQVTLLNMRYAENETIPANDLANAIFDATGNTIQTLSFTFNVKNYDKDDNLASINTQVIISAASINDSSIKQTSFHIFKCWNNIAFTEDKAIINDEDIDIPINAESYFLVLPESRRFVLVGNKNIVKTVKSKETASANFYFNIETLARYTYYDSDGWHLDSLQDKWVKQSPVGEYEITIDPGDTSWCTASIIGTYDQSKQYNVLNVKSKSPMSSLMKERTSFIDIKFKNNYGTNGNQSSHDMEILNSIKNASTVPELILPSAHLNGETITESEKLTKIKELTKEIESSDGKLTLLYGSATGYNNHSFNTSTRVVLQNTSSDVSLVDANTGEKKQIFRKVINDDINTFQTSTQKLKTLDKESTEYRIELDKANKYADKIVDEYNTFNTIINADKQYITDAMNNSNGMLKLLEFQYTEVLQSMPATIHVASSISNGSTGIKFTVTKNAESVVTNPNIDPKLTVKYNFINKNGDLVNADGTNSNLTPYTVELPIPVDTTTYTTNHVTSAIMTAASGRNMSTTTQTSYYNVIMIAHKEIDNLSLGAGWNNNRNDEGQAYWGGYNASTGTAISRITDDIYAVFYQEGQEAKNIIAGKKGVYVGVNLKSAGTYPASIKQYQSDSITFKGITKVAPSLGNGGGFQTGPLKINDNIYVISSSNATSQSQLEQEARNYYNSHSNDLVIDRQTVPVTISNGITGIKIQEVIVNPGVFDEVTVTYSSTGSWQIIDTNDSPSLQKYTFGNAFISRVSIKPWDDYEMEISFTINGGSETNIPTNSEIIETPVSSNGQTKFIFIQDGKSYEHKRFYNYYSFSATKWINNSCVVTYKLYNKYSLTQTSFNSVSATLYNSKTNVLDSAYLDRAIEYVYDHDSLSRDYTFTLAPYLTHITGLKFWIGLNVSGLTLVKKFESSLSSTGSQVQISANFNINGTKNVNIINALYNNVTTSTSNRVTGGGGGSDIKYSQEVDDGSRREEQSTNKYRAIDYETGI